MVNKKINSIAKKVRTLASSGLTPLEVGHANYLLNDPVIEDLAWRRYEVSFKCIEHEPIEWLSVIDERIPVLNRMMVSKCGCAAPYFFRQNIDILDEWKVLGLE